MKKLVVYYSLEGHTKSLAEAIAQAIGADLLQITPKDDIPTSGFFRYLKGGSQVMKKAKPVLLPVGIAPEAYDLLFIGSPVWAGYYAPALRSLFDKWQLKDKKIALFTSHRGGKGKALEQLAESLYGNQIIGQQDFYERDANYVADAVKWAEKMVEEL